MKLGLYLALDCTVCGRPLNAGDHATTSDLVNIDCGVMTPPPATRALHCPKCNRDHYMREDQIMKVHESNVGTYHPDPKGEVAWTINDTRGYVDAGPSCDRCGACECDTCPRCGEKYCVEGVLPGVGEGYCDHDPGEHECIGLSFAYVCLDGGESLCAACAEQAGVETSPCDCE